MKHLKKFNEEAQMNPEHIAMFAPYDIAKKLKEIGFDEPCLAKWALQTKGQTVPVFLDNFQREGLWFRHNSDPRHADMNDPNSIWAAPLHQQVVKWLNENHETFFYDGDDNKLYNEIRGFLENF
jgi:hypothetical protein